MPSDMEDLRRALIAEVRSAVREEHRQLQRDWIARQEEAQRQQVDSLNSCLERLFAQHGRQAWRRPEGEARRCDAAAGGHCPEAAQARAAQPAAAAGGDGSCSGGCLTAVPGRPLYRHHTWQPMGVEGEFTGSPLMESSTPPSANQPLPAGWHPSAPPSGVLLQLPPGAVPSCRATVLPAGPGGGTPVTVSDSDLDREGDRSCIGEPRSADLHVRCVVESPQRGSLGSPMSDCKNTEGFSDFKSEATQENDRWKHQWKDHVRAQVSRQLDDINTGSSFAHTISGYLGLRRHIGRLQHQSSPEFSVRGQPAVPRTRLEWLVDSPGFQLVCGTAIVASALFIGVQAEASVRNALTQPPSKDPEWFRTCDLVINAIAVVEVLMRLAAKRLRFFVGDDWKWNIVDLLLTLYSLAEEFALALEAEGTFSLTYTRLLRGFRMVRVLRVIRVMRLFRELRLMVCSTMQCLVSLSWALVLMCLIIYLFTVCFMQGVSIYLHRPEGQEEVRSELRRLYGSVLCGMFSLLLAVSGGDDWVNLVAPLGAISPIYQVLFSVYVLFVLIGVVNVVTSAFVQRACELSKLDRDLVIQSEIISHESFLAEMKGIFEEVDVDGSGRITWQKFREFMENNHVQAYFATQQLDTSDARELFNLLAAEGEGHVGLEEFILGCKRLRGQAKSSDVATLLRESKRSSRKFMRGLRKVEAQLGAICSGLNIGLGEWSHISYLGRSPGSAAFSSQPCTPARPPSPSRRGGSARRRRAVWS